MSRRREDLKALFAGEDPAPAARNPDGGNAPAETPAGRSPEARAPEAKALVPAFLRPQGDVPPSPPRAASGALKAMGLELDGLRQAAHDADALRERLTSGETVVEIDPALIDPAFVRDRMEVDAAQDAALEASLQEHGQQAPVLVRLNRLSPGRYEAVYGHRRIAALKRLGKPVRAIVRALDDEALVIAQGQENNQRRDLSFIERARFAAMLEGRGFSRAVIMAALDVHKSELARFISVAGGLPDALVAAIGPAPKTGRPRWMALAAALPQGRTMTPELKALTASAAFRALGSDKRFAAVMQLLSGEKRRPPSPPADVWRSADGALAAAVRPERGGRTGLSLSGPDGAAFARYLAERLDALHGEFRRRSDKDPRARS